MPKLSPTTAARLRKLKAQIALLPAAERAEWVRRVNAKLRTAPASVGAEAPPTPQLGAGVNLQFREWDLELANWLDGAYSVVSDRVAEVGTKAANVVSDAGFALWPLAAAALVFFYVYKNR